MTITAKLNPEQVAAAEAREPSGRFISLRVRFSTLFILIIALLFAASYFTLSRYATEAATLQVQEKLIDTLKLAAASIEGDEMIGLIEEAEFNDAGYSDDPRYLRQVEALAGAIEGLTYAGAYTYIAGDDPDEIVFVASYSNPDLAAENDEPEFFFLEEYALDRTSDIERDDPVFDGLVETTVYTDENGKLALLSDEHGQFVRGYTPITNSAGEVVGAVGVDFEGQAIYEARQWVLDQLIQPFVVVFVLGLILVFATTSVTTQPFKSLTQAAREISRGQYDQDLSRFYTGALASEISFLADAIEDSGRVHIQAETLKHEIQEIRIQIDEVKQMEQVSDITDSEFFQSLKQRASQLRSEKQASQK